MVDNSKVDPKAEIVAHRATLLLTMEELNVEDERIHNEIVRVTDTLNHTLESENIGRTQPPNETPVPAS